MAEQLKVPAQIDPNIGDLVKWEHPKNRMEWGWGHEHKNLRCKIGPSLL